MRAKRSGTTWQAVGSRIKKAGRGRRKRFEDDRDKYDEEELPRGGPDPVAGIHSAAEAAEPWSADWLRGGDEEASGDEQAAGEAEGGGEEGEVGTAGLPTGFFKTGFPEPELQPRPAQERQKGEKRRGQYEDDDESWAFWAEQDTQTNGAGSLPRFREPKPLPEPLPSLRPPISTGERLALAAAEGEDADEDVSLDELEKGEEDVEVLDFHDTYFKYKNTIMDTDGVEIQVSQIDTYEEAVSVLRFPEFLQASLYERRFFNLTPVQQCAMPLMLANRDFLASAFTGSGKTAAYLLPILTSLHFITRLTPGTVVASYFKGKGGQRSDRPVLGTIRGVRNGLAAVEFTPASGRVHRQMLPPDWVVELPEPPPRMPWKGPARPYALVLVPTRELCVQVQKEFESFSEYTPLRSVSLHGTSGFRAQFRELATGCDVLVATPGRLVDAMHRGVVKVDRIKHLVIDEVDRMMELGFQSQLTEIMEMGGMPVTVEGRQTSFWSATMPQSVKDLVEAFIGKEVVWVDCTGGQRNPLANTIEHVLIDSRPTHSSIRKIGEGDQVIVKGGRKGVCEFREGSRYRVMFTDGDLVERKMIKKGKVHLGTMKTEAIINDKLDQLHQILACNEFRKATVIVFCRKRDTTSTVFQYLKEKYEGVVLVHGGMSQQMRDKSVEGFRSGKFEILVATDIAARGLDIPNVTHVINFELPLVVDEFVHRCGRVGRIGRKGTAVTMITGREDIFKAIRRTLKSQGHEVPEWYSLEAMALPWRPRTYRIPFMKIRKGTSREDSLTQRIEMRKLRRKAERRQARRMMKTAERLMTAETKDDIRDIEEEDYRGRVDENRFFDRRTALDMLPSA